MKKSGGGVMPKLRGVFKRVSKQRATPTAPAAPVAPARVVHPLHSILFSAFYYNKSSGEKLIWNDLYCAAREACVRLNKQNSEEGQMLKDFDKSPTFDEEEEAWNKDELTPFGICVKLIIELFEERVILKDIKEEDVLSKVRELAVTWMRTFFAIVDYDFNINSPLKINNVAKLKRGDQFFVNDNELLRSTVEPLCMIRGKNMTAKALEKDAWEGYVPYHFIEHADFTKLYVKKPYIPQPPKLPHEGHYRRRLDALNAWHANPRSRPINMGDVFFIKNKDLAQLDEKNLPVWISVTDKISYDINDRFAVQTEYLMPTTRCQPELLSEHSPT